MVFIVKSTVYTTYTSFQNSIIGTVSQRWRDSAPSVQHGSGQGAGVEGTSAEMGRGGERVPHGSHTAETVCSKA